MANLDTKAENILGTSSKAAVSSWDKLLEIQVELFLPFELNFFLSNTDWEKATSILDVGCGNGYYLSRLQNFFNEKHYTGIDISPELSDIALTRYTNKDILFEQADFLNYRPENKFDIIIMRLIVQHMGDFPQLLRQASSLLNANGSLIIIEPDLDGFINIPATPMFSCLLREYGIFTEKTQKNRTILSNINQSIEGIPDWEITNQTIMAVPRTGPLNNTKFLEMYLLWIDIIERSSVIQFPFSKARKELDKWSKNASTFSQIGIQAIEMQHSARI